MSGFRHPTARASLSSLSRRPARAGRHAARADSAALNMATLLTLTLLGRLVSLPGDGLVSPARMWTEHSVSRIQNCGDILNNRTKGAAVGWQAPFVYLWPVQKIGHPAGT